MSKLDLEAIEARANATTPGLWKARDGDVCAVHDAAAFLETSVFELVHGTGADSVFAAHAHQDIPALVARIRELEAALDEAIDAIPTEYPCDGDDVPVNDDDAIAFVDRLRVVLEGK